MANIQELQDIISESSKKSILDAQANADKLNKTLQETIVIRKQLNDTMVGAKTMGDVNATALKEQKAIEQTNKLILQKQILQERLIAVELANQTKRDAIEKKQIAQADRKRKAIISNSQAEIDAYNKSIKAEGDYIALGQKQAQVEALKANAAVASGRVIQQSTKQVEANSVAVVDNEKKAVSGSSNISKGLGKVWGGLRMVANFLPGIGLAGLIGLLVDPIVTAISKLDAFKKSLTNAKVAQEDMAKALSGGEYAKAVTDVESLRNNIELAKQGFISKDGVVKQYNETIGKTTGQVKSLDEAEQNLNKNATAFINYTLLKAAAQVALEEAAKKAYEAEITRRKSLEEFNSDVELLKLGEIIPELLGDNSKIQARRDKENKKRREDEVKATEKAKNQQLDIARDFNKKAAEISKNNNFNFFDNSSTAKPKKAKDNSKELEKNARDSAAALVQIEIDSSKKIQDIYGEQADNEFFSLDARLNALKNFTEQSRNTIQLEAEKNLVGKKNTAQEEKLITEKLANDLEALEVASGKKVLAITKQNADIETRAKIERNQLALTEIEKQRDEDLTRLINAYQKEGDYSAKAQEELEQNRLKIINKYNLQVIDLQIQQAEELLAIRRDAGYDVTKQEAELSALILKGKDLELQGIDKANKDRLDKEKQNAEAIKEVAQEVFDFTRGLTAGIFESNIAELEKETDIRNKNRDLQIENIEASTLSEKEKADQISVINAQREQDQIATDRRIADQKRKQAIADKAFAIGQIAINTAVAISKALAQTGVLGAFVIPGIVALGAIQLATVLATPIPKFKHGKGKGNNYEGIAEVGDGYKHELVIEKDGRTWVTPNKPTLTYVGRDTEIIGGDAFERMRLMAKPDKLGNSGTYVDVNGIIQSQRETANRMEKAVNKLVGKQKRAGKRWSEGELSDWRRRNGV